MINKGGVKLLMTFGLLVFALVLFPNQSWARDSDGDGYNHRADCDDGNAAINPGAPEVCGNDVDENCDGAADSCDPTCTDSDLDGYYVESECPGPPDCNDLISAINPGVSEACGDGIDNDCNGFADEVCTDCTEADGDSDTYYAIAGCDDKPLDCDDIRATVNPGVVSEDCGTPYDDDCDGQANEGCPVADSDSDGDRLLDEDEITNGIVLSSEFDLWDESSNDWILASGGQITIPGSSVCAPGTKCLNPYVGDLFVIFRPLPAGQTEINFEYPAVTDPPYCNIFEFASSPTSPFTVWVLRERFGESATRQITAVSDKKAAVLIEDPAMIGTTGYSLPGSIQVNNGGLAWIYTYQIVDNIDTKCSDDCLIEGIRMDNIDIICRHFNNTAAHEAWHVLSALLTSNGHTIDTERIMYPATVFTGKKNKPGTYTIGDEFSTAGLIDPSFQ